MRTSTHPVQLERSNLLAMFIDGISGIISVPCAAMRDVHHLRLCPLILVGSENEHRHAVESGGFGMESGLPEARHRTLAQGCS
jgi:hypothetical protein